MCIYPKTTAKLPVNFKNKRILKRLKIDQIEKSNKSEEAFKRLVRTIKYSTIKLMSLIIDWLFPRRCFGCGKGDKYLCNLCEEKLKNGALVRKDQFEGIISIYKYDGLIKKIVEKMKYEFVSDSINELAKLMDKKLKLNYPNIVEYWQKEKFVLMAIPLYKHRKNWRGFNQSEILAEKLADALNLKCKNNILFRNIETINQATIKNRQKRQKNIENVFAINSKEAITKKIILVDDVVTSGATMTAALKILKGSGVEFLWGLSLCGVLK